MTDYATTRSTNNASGRPDDVFAPQNMHSEHAATLKKARRLAELLDDAWTLPGGIRVGWDGLLGLIPGVGDAAGLAMSGYVMRLAHRAGAPKRTLLRMAANVAVETIIGSVPILGDMFDIWWKANQRNIHLLERALARQQRG